MRHGCDVAAQRAKHVSRSPIVLHESHATGSIGQVLKIDL